MPEIDDYNEPFDYEYSYIDNLPEVEAMPTARPISIITGEGIEKIQWGPNWRRC